MLNKINRIVLRGMFTEVLPSACEEFMIFESTFAKIVAPVLEMKMSCSFFILL